MEYKKIVREIYNESVGEYWYRIKALYGEDAVSQFYDKREYWAIFGELLADIDLGGSTVLDIACGPGRWVIRYAKRGADLIAIDLSLNMLKYAKANCKKFGLNASFVCCDAENLPFKCNSFDLINCIDALVARPKGIEQSIQEVARVMKTGKIGIIEPSNFLSPIGPFWWIMNLCRKIKRKLGLKTYPPGVWLFPWQIKKIINEQGLKLLDIHSVGIILPLFETLLKITIT